MPAYLTFFPLGNADTTLVRLANDDLVLLDYANVRNVADAADKRIDLPAALREELDDAGRTSFRVVAFTHLDDDHIRGASDFFWFDHSVARQSTDRVKIDELWVPAAAITETTFDGDAWCIRQEARYRLKQGSGVKVFSRPGNLADFLAAAGLTIESRRHCIVNAGELVPGFRVEGAECVEFFAHSSFA